jgi:hypothetical protein
MRKYWEKLAKMSWEFHFFFPRPSIARQASLEADPQTFFQKIPIPKPPRKSLGKTFVSYFNPL